MREILVVLPETIKKDDAELTRDYEAINSCNWNDIRLKFPKDYQENIGFLVEFRPMDNPITYKEKMAFIFFVTLFRRMISDKKLGLNFYLPITKINENYNRCILKDAFYSQKQYFRKYICEAIQGEDVQKDDVVELTMQEWLDGCENFIGLRSVIKKYCEINFENIPDFETTEARIWRVFNFLLARSKGELVTSATYMRKFV